MLVRRLEAAGGAGGHADVAGGPDLCVHVVGKSLEAEQAIDGRVEGHRGVTGDFLLDGAEGGPSQEVLDVLFASPGHVSFSPTPGSTRGVDYKAPGRQSGGQTPRGQSGV